MVEIYAIFRIIWKKYKWVNRNMQWLLLKFKKYQNAIDIICVLRKILKKNEKFQSW